MTHEFLNIIEAYKNATQNNLRTVLATIVLVEGSSYRKEGTQMLIDQSNNYTGAISGGCVEQEVVRQSMSVFTTNCSKVFKYDGRYRLGCEGSIYVLIELFQPDNTLLSLIENAIKQRTPFSTSCSFRKEETSDTSFGTSFKFKTATVFNTSYEPESNNLTYTKTFQSLNRLFIFGIEHDAEKLSQMASFLGWEVIISGTEHSNINNTDFPYAKSTLNVKPEDIDSNEFCKNTAVIIMSHNYSKDLRFLQNIITSKVKYIGLLGPVRRREKLLNQLIETDIFIDDRVFDKIHGPVGLSIGSETPEEIALSIMAEVISVFKQKNVIPEYSQVI